MIEEVRKIMAPLNRCVNLMISRCKLTLVDDSTKTQSAQIEAYSDEIHDDAQRWQNFGFTSVPPNGSEGIALFVGGNRSTPLIVATENKSLRIKNLKSGEVGIYSSCGDTIILKSDNSIEIKTKKTVTTSDEISSESSKYKVKSDKISIGNGTDELLEIISELLGYLSSDTVTTMMGPQALLNGIQGNYTNLKTKIDKMKG